MKTLYWLTGDQQGIDAYYYWITSHIPALCILSHFIGLSVSEGQHVCENLSKI